MSLFIYFLPLVAITYLILHKEMVEKFWCLLKYSEFTLISGIRAKLISCGISCVNYMEEAGSGMIKLTASNYSILKTRMEDILYCKELFDPIECRGYKSVTTTDDEWKKLNRETIGHIRQWVDQSVFHHVTKEVDAYSF